MEHDISYSDKLAEPLTLQAIEQMLLAHQMGRSLRCPTDARKPGPDKEFDHNHEFWEGVLSDELYQTCYIKLNNFRIFEWVPRNPGLFHTGEASWQREEAFRNIAEIRGERDFFIQSLEAMPDHAERAERDKLGRRGTMGRRADRITIFNPYGKLSMLQGGVGCVRFKPVHLKNERASEHYILSASSSQNADEGIPIVLTEELYEEIIKEIKKKGYAAFSEIIGEIKYIPKELSDIYSARYGIPRVYLYIDRLGNPIKYSTRGFVSVAASFISEFDGDPGMYATYVTFDPGWQGARNAAARWLREEYVSGLYGGFLVTDFDQIAPDISEMLFSLEMVQTDAEIAKLIAELHEIHGYFEWDMLEKFRLIMRNTEALYMVKQDFRGNQGPVNQAIGKGADATQTIQNPINDVKDDQLPLLIEEIEKIKQALSELEQSDENVVVKGKIIEAQLDAKKGDKEGFFKKIMPIATRVVSIGEKVGVSLLTSILKDSMKPD